MCREISWMRQERALINVSRMCDDSPSYIEGDWELPHVRVNGHPAYDNGSYMVVDTVKDLEWTVLSNEFVVMKTFKLDKYAAIEWADRLKESDERVAKEDGR